MSYATIVGILDELEAAVSEMADRAEQTDSPEVAAEAMVTAELISKRGRRLSRLIKDKARGYFRRGGREFQVGEKRYYLGKSSTVRLRHGAEVDIAHAILDHYGVNSRELAEALAALISRNGWKQASVKKELGKELWEIFFEREYRDEAKKAAPRKDAADTIKTATKFGG